MSFLGEIKRRKVFQVAAVYAVVSWLLVQVITSISEPLSLPDWADTLVIVLLAIGFPIAVILAWAFDLTPKGIRAADSTKGESVQIGGSRFAYITQALVLLAVGFLVADQYFLGEQQNESTRPLVDSDAPSDGVRRYSINLGPTEPIFTSEVDTEIALSSDGRRLVYVLQIEGRRQLYQRELDQLTGQPIPGTNGATSPFFSPDGDWLGFRNLEGLQKIFFRGGQAIHLADNVRVQTGGAWTSDDSIIFSASRPGGGAAPSYCC